MFLRPSTGQFHRDPLFPQPVSLVAEHQVSIESFVDPDALNVKPRERTLFEFTPATEGNYIIRHELHGFTGQLVVLGK